MCALNQVELMIDFLEMNFGQWRKKHSSLCDCRNLQKGAQRSKKQPKRKHFPLNAPYSVIYRTPLKMKFSKDFPAKVIKQNFFSSFASCFFQKIIFPNDSPHFFSEHFTRSCKRPSTHFFMKHPENMKHEFNVRACLKNFTNPTFCF